MGLNLLFVNDVSDWCDCDQREMCDLKEEIRPGKGQEGDLKTSGSRERLEAIAGAQSVSRQGQK